MGVLGAARTFLVFTLLSFWVVTNLWGALSFRWFPSLRSGILVEYWVPWMTYGHVMYDKCADRDFLPQKWRPLAGGKNEAQNPWRETRDLYPWDLSIGYANSASLVRSMFESIWTQRCNQEPFEYLMSFGRTKKCNAIRGGLEVKQVGDGPPPEWWPAWGKQFGDTVWGSLENSRGTLYENFENNLRDPGGQRALTFGALFVLPSLWFWLSRLRSTADTTAPQPKWWVWSGIHLFLVAHFAPALLLHFDELFAHRDTFSKRGIHGLPGFYGLANLTVRDVPDAQLELIARVTIALGVLCAAFPWRRNYLALLFNAGIFTLYSVNPEWLQTLGLLSAWSFAFVSWGLFSPQLTAHCWEWYTLMSTFSSGLTKLGVGWPWLHTLGCHFSTPQIPRQFVHHFTNLFPPGSTTDLVLTTTAVCMELLPPVFILCLRFTQSWEMKRVLLANIYLYLILFVTIIITMEVPPLFAAMYALPHLGSALQLAEELRKGKTSLRVRQLVSPCLGANKTPLPYVPVKHTSGMSNARLRQRKAKQMPLKDVVAT